MPPIPGWTKDTSPFHKGERAAQEKVGLRGRMETLGRRALRDFMPDQHREFYAGLSMIFVGHVDAEGWPWASVLYGEQGFIQSPDSRKLALTTRAIEGDPLQAALAVGAPLGFVGMGLNNRRRNRVNGHVTDVMDTGFDVTVEQSFGNCPQYIKTREGVAQPQPTSPPAKETLDGLDDAARLLIRRAETFFVATSSQSQAPERGVNGTDMSHRGGKPGFVKVDGDTLTIPDFSGNNFFNTLGNIIENPRAGLLFVDYATGDLLMISGDAAVIWDAPEIDAFQGAERFWQLNVRQVHRLRAALPITWIEQEAAPNLKTTGSWEEVTRAL